MTEAEYRENEAFRKKCQELIAAHSGAGSLAGAGSSAGAAVALSGAQASNTKARPVVTAGVESPGLTIFLVALIVCFGWWFSSALFCAEDAKAYTMCMGANFTPQITQVLAYAPAALVLALLGVEFGMAVATVCHKHGVCAAPVRSKAEGALFAVAVFCLGCSLMAHGAVRLAANLNADAGEIPVIAKDMPLKQMLIFSVIAYVVATFFFIPVALKAKTYIGRLLGCIIAFVAASFIALVLCVVAIFVAIAIVIAIGMFFMSHLSYIGPWSW